MIQWNDTHDEQLKALSDKELLLAWGRSDGEPGDPVADAILAEIVRRDLDI